MKALIALMISVVAWPFLGQAASRELSVQQQQAYRFVTAKIPDPRASCAIEVDYQPLELRGFVGFTPLMQNRDQCPRVIQIDTGLERDWKSSLVMAHELVHLFRLAKNTHETAWLEEGLAKLVEHQYLGIGPITLQDQLLDLKEFSLETDHRRYVGDSSAYAMSYFFALYLYNRLGEDEFLREVMASSASGWDAIEEAALNLKSRGRISIAEKFLTRDSLWTHFALALLFNDSTLADQNLMQLDSRYKSLEKSKTALLSSKFNAGPRAPGWHIRYYQLPIERKRQQNELEFIPHSRDVSWYLVKKARRFEVTSIDDPAVSWSPAFRDFDYLIEVQYGESRQ